MNALESLAGRPLPFLRSSWPWRSLVYLLASAAPGIVVIALVVLSGVVWIPLGVLLVVPVLPLVARFERLRLRLIDHAPLPRTAWGREFGLGAVTAFALWWIDLAMIAFAIGGPVVLMLSPALQPDASGVGAMLASFAGVMLLPVAAYTLTAWAGARGVMTRAMLAPQDSQLQEVLRSRARLVDAYELERRRIERDLHDGAQQRLVALSMKLGMAGLDLPAGDPAGKLVAEAHEEAKRALAELRELIRGVHSRVLTDRGLPAAVREVADRSAVHVDVRLELSGRLPPAVEVAAFYVVSEALANVAKHSGAGRATVSGELRDGTLNLEILDDGAGGASPRGGLTGLADRVAVVGGRLSLSSPVGGPTLLRVEIPCA